MKPFGRDPELLVKRIVSWIQSELRRANARNAVFGLSGGFDSVHDDPPDRKYRIPLKRYAFFPEHRRGAYLRYARLIPNKR